MSSDLQNYLERKAKNEARTAAISAWHVRAHLEGGIPLPYGADDTWINVNVYKDGSDDDWGIDPEKSLDALATVAKFVSGTGLGIEKNYQSSDFELSVQISDGLTVRYYANREAVCTKRVVGSKVIPEKITPAREEEIVEWECEPISLLARGSDMDEL